MKVVAVIPCFNEARHIVDVVAEARKHVDMVLVSDGRSTDGTRGRARSAGAKVLSAGPGFVTGYGACIQQGITYVLNNIEADIIVLLDGDGQHDPAEIPTLLAPVLSGHADVVMGCRTVGNGMPGYRRFGNRLLSAICNIGAHFQPADAVTGYWVIATKAMPNLTEQKWGMAVELLIKVRSDGWRMTSVPVRAIYHENYTDNSTVSPLRLGITLLWFICKWRIRAEVPMRGRRNETSQGYV